MTNLREALSLWHNLMCAGLIKLNDGNGADGNMMDDSTYSGLRNYQQTGGRHRVGIETVKIPTAPMRLVHGFRCANGLKRREAFAIRIRKNQIWVQVKQMSSRAAGERSRNDTVARWRAANVEHSSNLSCPAALNHQEEEGGETSIIAQGDTLCGWRTYSQQDQIYYNKEAQMLECSWSTLSVSNEIPTFRSSLLLNWSEVDGAEMLRSNPGQFTQLCKPISRCQSVASLAFPAPRSAIFVTK